MATALRAVRAANAQDAEGRLFHARSWLLRRGRKLPGRIDRQVLTV